MKMRLALRRQMFGTLFLLLWSMCILRAAPGDANWDAAFGVPGVEGTISAMAVSGNDVYVGGKFLRIGGVVATNVAKWDGTNWSALGMGLGLQPDDYFRGVTALLTVGNEIHATGSFTNSGDRLVSSIVKWDGAQWVSVGGYFNNDTKCLAWDGHYLYAGGGFFSIAGVTANHIARWDGTNWLTLGNGVHYWVTGIIGEPRDYGQIYSMTMFASSLFVAGQIEMAGSIGTTNLARWSGSHWSAIRDGGSLHPGPLLADDSRLYTGYRGGIACYNGTSWFALGPTNDEPTTVAGLVKNGPDLFAGGPFASLGNLPARHVAKWDGSRWSALGQGIGAVSGGGVFTMTSNGSDLFVAGVFHSAGGKPSTNIARWRIPHELKIRRAAHKALLSWPATGSNLWVESASGPSGPDWSVLSNTPGLHDGQCVVTNFVTDTGLFFRLRGR